MRSRRRLTTDILGDVWRHPANADRRLKAVARAVGWQLWKRTTGRYRDIDAYNGIKVRLHCDSGSASNIVYFGPFYEYDSMTFVRQVLRPGDGFIDGGANIGTFSLLAASILGPDGFVDAFEPAPHAYKYLAENVALNHLEAVIRTHEIALGANAGTVEFLTGWDVSNRVAFEGSVGPSTPVTLTTLDAALGDRSGYALGKLDLEGFEYAALAGAQARLAAGDPPVWILEVIPCQLKRAGYSPDDVLELLRDHHFDVAAYSAADRQIYYGANTQRDHNIIAVARDARGWLAARLD